MHGMRLLHIWVSDCIVRYSVRMYMDTAIVVRTMEVRRSTPDLAKCSSVNASLQFSCHIPAFGF